MKLNRFIIFYKVNVKNWSMLNSEEFVNLLPFYDKYNSLPKNQFVLGIP